MSTDFFFFLFASPRRANASTTTVSLSAVRSLLVKTTASRLNRSGRVLVPVACCLATTSRFACATATFLLSTHHVPTMVRRSHRLQGRTVVSNDNDPKARPQKVKSARTKSAATPNKKTKTEEPLCLPRTRESELEGYRVMGIDEAGRGPLAGPVVVAAAIVPHSLPGITDSKLLTKEEERERLYEQLVASPNIQWAVAVIDAARIDEINILQATLEGMRLAAHAVMEPQDDFEEASIERQGCYVVCGPEAATKKKPKFYALIDGNRLPKDMSCEAETIIKGDSKEYCIAAASVLAKVTRDRLMHEYDKMYPLFKLSQHKGYPTAAHMALLKEHGASPIHRRSFAPLKHMTFDKDGRVVTDDS